MNEGDVVITPVRQADGRTKNRPAIILRVMPPFDDFLVCGISRQLHHLAPELDEIRHKRLLRRLAIYLEESTTQNVTP
jgi:mRNA interferase MazF